MGTATTDPTPPSPPDRIPPWARQMMKEHQLLRKDHEALKAKQGAEHMAYFEVLNSVNESAKDMSMSSQKMQKQVWGAIKELRKQIKEPK